VDSPTQRSWLHPQFGRRVAQLRGKSSGAAGLLVGAFFVLMGLAMLWTSKFPANLGGLLPLTFVAYIAHRVRSRSGAAIEVFERGVRLRLVAPQEFALGTVRSASFRITDVSVNGGYNHTVAEVTLATDAGEARWSALVERNDPGFAAVRAMVSASIASRLRDAVARDGRAAWVPGVALTPDGVELDTGFIGGEKQTRAVRFADLVVEHGNARCTLRRRGEREPARVVDESDANFFPGLLLFEQLGRRP
jgi:hypothetical protein